MIQHLLSFFENASTPTEIDDSSTAMCSVTPCAPNNNALRTIIAAQASATEGSPAEQQAVQLAQAALADGVFKV